MWKAQDAEHLLCLKPSTEPQLSKHHTEDTPPLLWKNINKGREVQVLFIKLHTKSKVCFLSETEKGENPTGSSAEVSEGFVF